MDDKALVREVHGTADLLDQAQPTRTRQLLGAHVVGDVGAVDVLHHQVRLAGVGRSAIEQPRDVRMPEVSEDLALAAQSVSRIARGDAADHLDRDAAVELGIDAFGEEDRAHAATADLVAQQVGPNAGPWCAGCDRRMQRGDAETVAQVAIRRRIGGNQGQRLLAKSRIAFFGAQPGLALPGRHGQQTLEQFLQACPARSVHDCSCSRSQALAKRRSRSTVGTETPTTWAISSRVRPSR